ncbi:MAG: transcriptional regulator [Planctomycetota bacterium]
MTAGAKAGNFGGTNMANQVSVRGAGGPAPWSRAARQVFRRILEGSGETLDRRQLQAQTGLAWATVCQAMDHIEGLGLIRPAGHGPSKGGRPPLGYELDPDRRTLLGLDYELSRLTLRAVTLTGETRFERRVPLDATEPFAAVRSKLVGLLDAWIAAEGWKGPSGSSRGPLALGIGVPVLRFMEEKGRRIVYSTIQAFESGLLLEELHAKLKLPVYMGSNIHALALAEGWFGAARGCGSFVYLSFRTGVAMAMVVNGRVQAGAHHLAGELGHWRLPGEDGSLQSRTGAVALLAAAELAGWRAPGGSTEKITALLAAAAAGDPAAAAGMREAAVLAGRTAAQVALLLDPERLVVGGTLALAAPAIDAPLRAAYAEHGLPTHTEQVELVYGKLPDGGALGAATLGLMGLMG